MVEKETPSISYRSTFWGGVGVRVEVNFMVANKQGLSFVQMVDLIKFTLDFKTALNYKLNTMSYKKFQLILILVISFFSNTFFLISHWALKTYLYLTPCLCWQI